LVVIAAWSTAGHVRGLFEWVETGIDRAGSAWVRIGGRSLPVSAEYWRTSNATRSSIEPELDRPLLVLHPLDDQWSP
jgi:hypothetical protein